MKKFRCTVCGYVYEGDAAIHCFFYLFFSCVGKKATDFIHDISFNF